MSLSAGATTGPVARTRSRLHDLLPGRQTWRSLGDSPGRNLIAGLTVGVVALPLALGFGIASGVGARAGLVTAAVAGVLAALFGGSSVQVSGPTGAMTVVLVPIVHEYGVRGVLTIGLVAGLVLVVLAVLRAARWMAFVPTPVVEGFTLGIALVIGLQQVPAALGVHVSPGTPLREAGRAVLAAASHPNWPALMITGFVVASMLVGARLWPTVPVSLAAVVLATIAVGIAPVHVALIGHLPAGFPAPTLGFVEWSALPALLPSALAVAALAGLESLMSATVADGMSVSERHDGDRELLGQGLANLAAPLFGGVAATGAIARTAVNVRSGATSRLSAAFHGLVIAAVLIAAAPLVARVPLSALAGVLIATAIRMVDLGSIRALSRAGLGELMILLLTAAITLLFNLVTAVVVGLLAAGVMALRMLARSAFIEQVELHEGLPHEDHHAEERALLGDHIVAYRIDGPVFFGAAHRFLLDMAESAHAKVVILRLSRVSAVDATGARVLGDLIDALGHRGALVLVSGIRKGHDRVLGAAGLLQPLQEQGRVFETTPEAIAAAKATLGLHAGPAHSPSSNEPRP